MVQSANTLRSDPRLWNQAQVVSYRARHIPPLEEFTGGTAVGYRVDGHGKFCGMELVPEDLRHVDLGQGGFGRP